MEKFIFVNAKNGAIIESKEKNVVTDYKIKKM